MVPTEAPVISPRIRATASGRPASKLSWRSCVRAAGTDPAHGDGPRPVSAKGVSRGTMSAWAAPGLANGDPRALADDPLDGRGEGVVGRAVLVVEGVGDGAPGALLREQGRPAHALSHAAELDEDRIRRLHHDDRHGRQKIVDYLDEDHLQSPPAAR